MRILIAGQPRTGTSALLCKLHSTLAQDHDAWYEPKEGDMVKFAHNKNVIIKLVLMPHWFNHVRPEQFEKQLLIIRDPRDTIISALLWWVSLSNWHRDEKRVAAFIELLKEKEATPSAVPFLELVHLWTRFEGKSFLKMYAEQLKHALAWHNQHDTCYVFRYVDLVEGRVADLGAFLGIDLSPETETAHFLRWHGRTKAYGNWRHWFTAEDVIFFQAFFESFHRQYDMGESWDLAAEQRIPADHGSDFLRILLQEKHHWHEIHGQLPPRRVRMKTVVEPTKVV